jgi:hypothetical protein
MTKTIQRGNPALDPSYGKILILLSLSFPPSRSRSLSLSLSLSLCISLSLSFTLFTLGSKRGTQYDHGLGFGGQL